MKRLNICLGILLLTGSIHAQSTINSTGNIATINGDTYSYSIGEMALVHTVSNSNLVVTQGVLQALNTTVGVEKEELTSNEFSVYPNPTRDIINMRANLLENGNIIMKLFDVTGRELISKDWNISTSHEEKQLNLQSFATGQYILNIQYTNDYKVSYQSFKIQKLN